MKLGINLSVEYHAFSVSQLSLDTLFVCSESGPDRKDITNTVKIVLTRVRGSLKLGASEGPARMSKTCGCDSQTK